MGNGPCTGQAAAVVFVRELRFDRKGRLKLTPPHALTEQEDDAVLSGLHTAFRSTGLPAREHRPRHLVPGVCSIAKEVEVPLRRGGAACSRLYVVNFVDNTQRVFMCEGFPADGGGGHTTLADLWEVQRTNPSFAAELACRV